MLLRRAQSPTGLTLPESELRRPGAGDKDAHELAQDVAQGHEVKKAEGMEELLPLNVVLNFRLQRKEVGEQVTMREHDALWLRGRTRT